MAIDDRGPARWKPPRVAEPTHTAAAVSFFLTAALAMLLVVARWAMGKTNPDSHHNSSAAELLGWSIPPVVIAAVSIYIGAALLGRRSWAAWAGAVVVVGLGVAQLTWTLRASSDDPGDGRAYAGMGAFMLLFLGVALGVALIYSQLHPRRARAAWYHDPSGVDQWRYWNGTSWTGQVWPF